MSLNVEPFISGLGEEIRKANDLLEGVHMITEPAPLLVKATR